MTARDEFEEWASDNGYISCLKRKKDESYFYGMTANAWDVWQARQQEIDALKDEIERLKEWTDEDLPLPEDDWPVVRNERGVSIVTDNEIRDVFLSHGFKIKDGCDDLKPYVYEAARALLTRFNNRSLLEEGEK